jgi:hypothetical protein
MNVPDINVGSIYTDHFADASKMVANLLFMMLWRRKNIIK